MLEFGQNPRKQNSAVIHQVLEGVERYGEACGCRFNGL